MYNAMSIYITINFTVTLQMIHPKVATFTNVCMAVLTKPAVGEKHRLQTSYPNPKVSLLTLRVRVKGLLFF